jgi:hypothetical protein
MQSVMRSSISRVMMAKKFVRKMGGGHVSREEKKNKSVVFVSVSLSLCSLFLVRFGNVYKVEGGGGGDVDV